MPQFFIFFISIFYAGNHSVRTLTNIETMSSTSAGWILLENMLNTLPFGFHVQLQWTNYLLENRSKTNSLFLHMCPKWLGKSWPTLNLRNITSHYMDPSYKHHIWCCFSQTRHIKIYKTNQVQVKLFPIKQYLFDFTFLLLIFY